MIYKILFWTVPASAVIAGAANVADWPVVTIAAIGIGLAAMVGTIITEALS